MTRALQDTGWVVGLMSGTSCDGIDAALVRTDGEVVSEQGACLFVPYEESEKQQLKSLLQGKGDVLLIEDWLTRKHAMLVEHVLAKAGFDPASIAAIGFHGHTITHRPEESLTWQIGNGGLLAALTQIPVVCDFRRQDMAQGGQGAPLVPIYHYALVQNLPKPIAVLNLGGVGNVTWIGETEQDLLAFDTGPGNAYIDDWVALQGAGTMDKGGALGMQGTVDEELVSRWLNHPYFAAKPPKSLDRQSFATMIWNDLKAGTLSLHDGAATLAAFTVASVMKATAHFPVQPTRWLVAGGGRYNQAIMNGLQHKSNVPIEAVEKEALAGDFIEAQAFAYLAMRRLKGKPISFPGTTGVTQPALGGAVYQPSCGVDVGR